MSRRLSSWKVLGILSGGLALVALGFWLWIESVAARKWAAMEKGVAMLLAEAKARDPGRPVLRGEALPGDAWGDYRLAVAEYSKVLAPQSILAEFHSRSARADRAKAEQALASLEPALEHLRRGTRRAEARSTLLEEAVRGVDPPLMRYQMLACAAACRARLLAEEGRAREAAELLLDVCRFGTDVGENGTLIGEMIGIAILWYGLEGTRELLAGTRLDPALLLQIERELEIVDRSFPRHGCALLNETAWVGNRLIEGRFLEGFNHLSPPPGPSDLRIWRYGFSRSLLEADAFHRIEAWSRRAAEGGSRSWSEEKALWSAIWSESKAARNPVIELVELARVGEDFVRRERLAQLRLVWAAASFRRTGEAPGIDDPFGTKLRVSIQGDSLKAWSAGRDGADDGGQGEWHPGRGRDIVLEIKR